VALGEPLWFLFLRSIGEQQRRDERNGGEAERDPEGHPKGVGQRGRRVGRVAGSHGTGLGEVAVEAAAVQFRPMLLLIVVAMLGMIPAALAHGIGSDIQRPLATVVVGGLMSTLLLTLIALPAVYVLAYGAWRRRMP